MTDQPVTRIAICFIGAGSCYGNGHDAEAAIKRCWAEVAGFARAMGGFKDPDTAKVPIHVFDYDPYDQISWSDGRVFGHRTKGADPVEITALETVMMNGKGERIT